MAEREDHEPATENWTPLFDTGAVQAQPITATEPVAPPSHPIPAFAPPEVVPGTYQYVRRWLFALLLVVVWAVTGVGGAALHEWWRAAATSQTSTTPLFVVLVYLVVAGLAALLLTLVPHRPTVSALAIAVMSSPLGAVAGAALMYGAAHFGWFGR